MKYKAGDRVRIKNLRSYDDLVKKIIEPLDPPYVITIEVIIHHAFLDSSYGYIAKETNQCYWYDEDIEGIYEEPDPIENRFEILDL